MTASNTTLASLWVDDGNGGSPMQMATTLSPSRLMASQNVGELKDDVLRFYRGAGLEPVAREAGVLDSNGELPTSKPSYDVIRVPVASPARSGIVRQQVVRQLVKSEAASQIVRHVLPQVIRQVKTEGGTMQQVVRQVKTDQLPHVVRQVVAQHGTTPQSIAPRPEMVSPVIRVSTPQRIQASPHIVHTPKGTQIIATPLDFGSPSGPGWSHGQKRPLDYYEVEPGKRKKEKGGKGLRHFSMKVCEKVQRKGVTSYNEVADELVAEFTDPRTMTASDVQYDQKNIRRRVYDALNVLMAMNIISKEKKEIRWIGLPTNSAQECQNMEFEKRLRKERVRHKTQQLQELILQQIAFKNLVQRNRENERRQGTPTANSAIQLPFIIVNTSKKTVIDCSITNDKYEYLFNFDNTFEIHDDIEVLKRMGMAFGLEQNQCTQQDLNKAVRMVPKALEPYVLELANVKKNSNTLGSRSLITAGPSAGPSTSAMHASSTSSFSVPHTFTENSMDAEVASATRGLSRHNSLSFNATPDEEYSDDSASERSSPIDV